MPSPKAVLRMRPAYSFQKRNDLTMQMDIQRTAQPEEATMSWLTARKIVSIK